MRTILDKAMLSSRYLLVVFFFGLFVALGAFAVRFVYKLGLLVESVFVTDDKTMLIDVLHLVDSALVASLIVMVALSSHDSLVSRLADDRDATTSWVGMIDPGNLKIKLSTALIAISAIHLLQIAMGVSEYDDRTIIWSVVIHGMFLVGVLALGVLDWTVTAAKRRRMGAP